MWSPKIGSSSSFNSPGFSSSETGFSMARRTKSTTLDVDAEYTKALHTKSFVDIWAKAHPQPNAAAISTARPVPDTIASGLQPSSPLPHDFLLDPSQASLLAAAAASSGGSALLLDYLDVTLQSCTSCTSLLASIDRTRSLHHAIRFLLLRLSAIAGVSATEELADYIELGNPLSPLSLPHFHRAHALYPPLIRRLTEERRRLSRRERVVRGAMRASGMAAIAAVLAMAVAAAVLAAHAAVAAVSEAPKVVTGWRRRWRRWVSLEWLEKAGRRVDAAARGAYILGRELDTVSRMVRRAHDEVEHGRDVARLVLRCPETTLLAREAAREMELGEAGIQELLEELEEHVYLCLLTINHSRRLVAEEMADR